MKNQHHLFKFSLLMISMAFLAGCEDGFVQDQARTSLASFITGVLTTAVNQLIAP